MTRIADPRRGRDLERRDRRAPPAPDPASGAATAGNPVCGIGVPAAGSATLLVRNSSASALNGNINITVFVIN